MKIINKIISLILLTAFVLSVSASCSSNNTNNNDNDNSAANDENSLPSNNADSAVSSVSDNGRENTPDSLPENLDFGGQSLRILMRDEERFRDEIYAESEIGEIVNDAVFRRNQSVEERLDMKFEYAAVPQSSFNSSVKNSVNAGGDDYDLVAGFAYYIPSLSLDGLFMNWKNMPHIDLSKTWWSADCTKELTVDGKLYYVTGDISLALTQSVYVYYFNKQMAQDFSVPNLYQLVLDGKWTFGKFAEIAKSVLVDVDGDGIYDKNDKFGYVAWEFANVDGYFAAFDQPVTVMNGSGLPELAVNTEKTANIIDMTRDLMYNSGMIYYNSSDKDTVVPNMFINGQNMFYYSELYDSGTVFKSMESDFGILPCPKYDEAQTDYRTVPHDNYSLFCVPITCTRKELTGAAAEAMAAESYRRVTPTYFETALKVKYARDEESSKMLDIILSGATFNFGVVYSESLGNVGYVMRDLLLFNDTNKSFAAYWEKRETNFQKSLDKVIDKFENLSGE